MKYRKKPVVVDAIRFHGGFKRIDKWVAQWHDEMNGPGMWMADDGISEGNLVIDTLEGEMTARKGDWIIRGINGEFYPCKPDIFKKTYEEVKE